MADPTFQNGMTPGGTDKNGMAVASLVLGIIAVCCCCVSGLSLVLGILAIVFSILSRKNPAKSGLGTAGLLMGVLLGRHLIFNLVQLYFPPCFFYTVTHFYCPGCGNTRTVLALLHGHPLQALHNNAAFCYLLVVLVLLYLQKVLRCFGKPVQLLPKGNWFPVVSVCICMAYCLIRNFIPWMQPLPV